MTQVVLLACRGVWRHTPPELVAFLTTFLGSAILTALILGWI